MLRGLPALKSKREYKGKSYKSKNKTPVALANEIKRKQMLWVITSRIKTPVTIFDRKKGGKIAFTGEHPTI